MSRAITRHPPLDRLLRYADGDLETSARDEVGAHLAGCGKCGTRLSEIESGAADYRDAWKRAWKETAAPPPAPWFDLRERLEYLDRRPEPAPRSLLSRWRWGSVAAAALIAAVVFYRISDRPVSAAELLREAAVREPSAAQPRPPIRLSGWSGSFVRPAVWRPSNEELSTVAGGPARPLSAKFKAANYSWEDPLSARSFSAWRETLPDRRDHVVEMRGADGASSYEVSTRTESGTLEEARLRLRVSDLHVIRGSLRFRDQEVVEIEEIAGRPPDLPKAPDPVAGQPSVLKPAPPLEEAVSPSEELRVWAALHHIDADVGEQIEVRRDSALNAIVVTALALAPERRRALEDAVGGFPRVDLRFREPQSVREPSRRVAVPEGSEPPPLLAQLESQLGGGPAAEFVNRLLETSDTSLLRAQALRELAQRFSPETEALLSHRDRALLDSLFRDHFVRLEETCRRALADARRISAVAAPAPVPARAATRLAHAQNLMTATGQVNEILTKALAIGGSATAGQSNLEIELARALSRMEAEILASGPVFRGAQ
jgi:Putative zinc-finger